jgi:hypothetical protein
MNPKKHLNQFLTILYIRLIEYDDLMERVFLQNLISPTHEWYPSLPTNSICSFDDVKVVFLNRYSQPITYHTILADFTRIHLEKNERIKYFNMHFFRTL